MTAMRAFLGCLALLVAVNAAAQVYRWTDEKGRVVYGNEPPPGAKSSADIDLFSARHRSGKK